MTTKSRKVHVIVSGPYDAKWYPGFWKQVAQGRVERWQVTRKFEKGDLALFYFTTPIKAIVAVGGVTTGPVEHLPQRWDEAPYVYCRFEPVVKLENPIRLEDCGDLPKKMTVRGTGQVAGENVGGLMGKIVGANSGVENVVRPYVSAAG